MHTDSHAFLQAASSALRKIGSCVASFSNNIIVFIFTSRCEDEWEINDDRDSGRRVNVRALNKIPLRQAE